MTSPRILVVEDEAIVARDIAMQLNMLGYTPVGPATRGEEAIAMALDLRPDLILMDVVMPGQNGFQLTRAINRTPEYTDIPIFICTSKSLETDRVWGMRQGAKDYITKPVDAAELFAKIKALG